MHNGSRTRQGCQKVQIGYLRSTVDEVALETRVALAHQAQAQFVEGDGIGHRVVDIAAETFKQQGVLRFSE